MSGNIIIPSSPADRKKLKDGVDQIVNALTRMDSEKEYIKETLAELEEKFDIKKKFLRKMAVDQHKAKFDDDRSEREDYEDLFEQIMK